jgi:cation/acetate symporter
MSSAVYERIRKQPKFDELVRRRSRFAWTLSAIVLGIYFTFIMVVAFAPQLLATPVAAGATTTVAWPIGVGMVVLFWIMTGVYIRRANSEFDELNSQIVKEATK